MSATNKICSLLQKKENIMNIFDNLSILAEKCCWLKKIFYFEKLESTNTSILELLPFYKEMPICVVALEQTLGKGRLSNRWISPKGNIYLSLLVPFSYIPKNLSLLSMLPAIAVIKALENLGIESFIKWPNDILIKSNDDKILNYFLNYRKIGGILVQTHNEHSIINHAVIGIGINLISNPDIKNNVPHSACLNDVLACDYFNVLSELICVLDNLFHNFDEKYLFDFYIKKCITINNLVSFNNKKFIGKAVGIKHTGALLVEFENKIIEINADEVHLC